ncbi:MAG: hypothetical protein WC323_04300 [Patescibacteria group bacterium]|jgi:1-deoxy-D-xylulose 5-phosphate reductoisomerase
MSEELNKKLDKILIEVLSNKENIKKLEKKTDKMSVEVLSTKENIKKLEKKTDKMSVEVLSTKEDLKQYATKNDLDQAVDKIITAVDGLAKKTEKVQDEQTANIAAHDRFEGRITKLEQQAA